ncbi:hypothetical protein EV145_104395 [Flavobacterium sp. 245]|nr:hypothetical protein EV145_104395 [Flavobacterium sp. 245]
MQKGYKISFVIYSGIVLFCIFFMYILSEASDGHKATFSYYHYLIIIVAIMSILLLLIFPRISIKKNNLKFITGLSTIAFLTVSLYFSLKALFLFLSDSTFSGSNTVITIFIGIFIVTIIYLIKHIILELRAYKKK